MAVDCSMVHFQDRHVAGACALAVAAAYSAGFDRVVVSDEDLGLAVLLVSVLQMWIVLGLARSFRDNRRRNERIAWVNQHSGQGGLR